MKLIQNKKILKNIQFMTENSIINAQKFIKTKFDISSISLREIRRWGILFEWFIELLKKPFFKDLISFEDIYLYSLNLSIYLCYYIRIYNKELRRQFCNLMTQSFGENFIFDKFPIMIEKILAEEVSLDKGIAKNRALLENLFSIFVCLNTKIPLFIIGKPGCSKSLSSQLIFKSMIGKNSSNAGILKIFQKARQSLKNKKLENEILSVIYFDEMGLAEISKNNPLKVIHSELEYDDNTEKVSFIGISNWSLDASKMNRGIHLSIPEPDYEDLIETALAIAESYDIRLKSNYKEYFENLAKTYFEYKEKLSQNPHSFDNGKNKNLKEFHGTRDFYHLIKISSNLIVKTKFTNDNLIIENILNESIERNFGGLDNSIKNFKTIFKKYYPNTNEINEYNVMNCLEKNIEDPECRYLLIVSKSSISYFLITLILDKLKKKHVFYYGSNFEEDTIKGYYSAKVLNKVQITMSNDNVMILKNLTSVYPSLYDLFNQNFRKIGESFYAKIALGDSNSQNYLVNKKFRCVILLDKNEIDEQDPPFINRFEKHITTFEHLLNKNQVMISKNINQIIMSLIENDNLKINLSSQLINCDLDEIQAIIYQLSELSKKEGSNNNSKDEINIEDIEINEDENEINNSKFKEDELINNIKSNESGYKKQIYEKVIPTFSQDLIFHAQNSIFLQKYQEEFKQIFDIYTKNEEQHKNLKSYLEKLKSKKHVIYTFSNILDSIFELNNEINNKEYGIFTENKTKNIFVNQSNSERLIDDKIIDFYQNNNYNLCIFHLDTDDCIHLNHLNFLIQNTENNLKLDEIKSKIIIFIIHIKREIIKNQTKKRKKNDKNRILHNEYLISHLTEYKQFFIDNLNGKNISLNTIFKSSNIELFNNEQLIDLDEEFTNDLYHAFTYIKYNIKANFSDIKKEEYIEKICEFINQDNNKDLKILIQNSIKNKIKKIDGKIIMNIFSKYDFEDNDVDLISVIIKYMKSIYNTELIKTIVQFEENHILSTKLINFNEEIFKKIYEDFVERLESTSKINFILNEIVEIDLILGISYPFIITIFDEIITYSNTLLNDYLENEYNLRHEYIEDKNEYFDEKQRFEKNVEKEFEKTYLNKIFRDDYLQNQKELGKTLVNDYAIYFLIKSNKESNKEILKFFQNLYDIYIEQNQREDGNENNIIQNLSKFILFTESYKNYICFLIEYVHIFNEYINNFLNDFIFLFSKNSFKTSNQKISVVNDVFFNIFESVVYCILNIKERFEKISDEKFEKFLNKLKIFLQILMKTNIELRLTLKQILYLSEFIQVAEIFTKKGIHLKENLQIYFDLLKKENEQYLNNNNNQNQKSKENNIDPIDEEYKFLKNKIGHLKEYPNLIVKIINNKIKKTKEENYRVRLLKILCSNNLFLIKSKIIFYTLLRNFNIRPKNIKNKRKETENMEEESEEEEEENKNTGIYFLTNIENNKNNLIIQFLNENDNNCLDEILLSLFDGEFSYYFELKKTNENLILNQSFEILKQCIIYIEDNDCTISKNNRLGILYCISYIKYYCYQFSFIIFNEEFEEFSKNEIYDFLNNPNTSFRNIIKLYILKILNLIIIRNYKGFLDLIEQKQEKLFFKDFDFNEKVPCSLNYLFIHNETFENYKAIRKCFIETKNQNFISNLEILEIIKENDFLIFYDLIINEVIANLKNTFNKDFYNKFCRFMLDIINKLNLPDTTKDILSLFYNYNSIVNILPFINEISSSDYEILLYSHKFSLITSLIKTKSFYSKIISPGIKKIVKESYIPGGEPNDSLLIKSGEDIQNYFKNGGQEAVYMCSCNFWYQVGNCGRPTVTFPCENCGEILGGKNHILEKRKGHVRIYQDKKNIDKNAPEFKLLDDLMKEVEKEKNLQICGFKKVKKEFFSNEKKKVRNMSNISYRILNFIFYSCIYYSGEIGYLNDDDLKDFIFLDSNIKNVKNINRIIYYILKKDWDILKNELLKREIGNIQCFLNSIFPKIIKLLNENSKEMKNALERSEFEDLFNQMIEISIEEYKNYETLYIKNNNEILEIKNDTIKSILEETSNVNALSSTIFPLMKYFYVTNYPSYEKFSEQFKSIQKNYPVINNYLYFPKEKIQFLKNFDLINPFVVYMMNKYSNKILREDAKKKIIKDELKKIQDIDIEQLFQNFRMGWKNIYKSLSNYDCHGRLPEKDINEEDNLAYCLNDNLEDGYGKYIATAYKDFISCQNDFLKPLIENNYKNEYLYSYCEQIKNEIIIQRAKKQEVISIEIKNNEFKSFNDLIYTYSFRNCFKEDGNVNYLNYKEIKFDIMSIEIELAKILLTEKRLLANEQNQDFIIYEFEGFNHNNNLILNYKEKIKEIKLLSNEEKANLENIIEKVNKIK